MNQKTSALEVLHDVLSQKKYTRVWQKPFEDVIFKYIDLCVELRSGKYAKDGLIQYRQLCQQVNIVSLENVIKHYLDLTLKACADAQQKAGLSTLDIEDLDAEETAESMLTSGTTEHKQLSDRENLSRWLKFLWDTYRNVLDVLRLNAKLEPLYQARSHNADRFSAY